MKRICELLTARVVFCLVVLVGSASVGSAEPEVATFRFADAAGIPGKVSLMVDSLKLKPAGFAAGDTTGAIGILPGTHKFTVASVEAGTATADVPMPANNSTTVIAYCSLAIDPQTKAAKKVVQLLTRSNPLRDSGRHFQLLLISTRPQMDIILNGASIRVKAMKELRVPEPPMGSIRVDQGGKPVVQFNAPQAGNFFVVLYEEANGNLAGFVIPDYK